MIGILNFGANNAQSVANMLNWLGHPCVISADLDELKSCRKYILPGVGSFDVGMKSLKTTGLASFITDMVIGENKPILGICLGMQLLLEGSEEGTSSGLGIIKGYCKKFVFDEKIRIPHMGWNAVSISKTQRSSNFNDFESDRFYFVHSYHAEVNSRNQLFETFYGQKFISGICKNEKIIGVQFHPEKSHKYGMKLLTRFTEINND